MQENGGARGSWVPPGAQLSPLPLAAWRDPPGPSMVPSQLGTAAAPSLELRSVSASRRAPAFPGDPSPSTPFAPGSLWSHGRAASPKKLVGVGSGFCNLFLGPFFVTSLPSSSGRGCSSAWQPWPTRIPWFYGAGRAVRFSGVPGLSLCKVWRARRKPGTSGKPIVLKSGRVSAGRWRLH